jgi:hypothetical protein
VVIWPHVCEQNIIVGGVCGGQEVEKAEGIADLVMTFTGVALGLTSSC